MTFFLRMNMAAVLLAAFGTPAMSQDLDGDGLSDADELLIGTSLGNPDTDGDGSSDYAEVKLAGTDPLNPSESFRVSFTRPETFSVPNLPGIGLAIERWNQSYEAFEFFRYLTAGENGQTSFTISEAFAPETTQFLFRVLPFDPASPLPEIPALPTNPLLADFSGLIEPDAPSIDIVGTWAYFIDSTEAFLRFYPDGRVTQITRSFRYSDGGGYDPAEQGPFVSNFTYEVHGDYINYQYPAGVNGAYRIVPFSDDRYFFSGTDAGISTFELERLSHNPDYNENPNTVIPAEYYIVDRFYHDTLGKVDLYLDFRADGTYQDGNLEEFFTGMTWSFDGNFLRRFNSQGDEILPPLEFISFDPLSVTFDDGELLGGITLFTQRGPLTIGPDRPVTGTYGAADTWMQIRDDGTASLYRWDSESNQAVGGELTYIIRDWGLGLQGISPQPNAWITITDEQGREDHAFLIQGSGLLLSGRANMTTTLGSEGTLDVFGWSITTEGSPWLSRLWHEPIAAPAELQGSYYYDIAVYEREGPSSSDRIGYLQFDFTADGRYRRWNSNNPFEDEYGTFEIINEGSQILFDSACGGSDRFGKPYTLSLLRIPNAPGVVIDGEYFHFLPGSPAIVEERARRQDRIREEQNQAHRARFQVGARQDIPTPSGEFYLTLAPSWIANFLTPFFLGPDPFTGTPESERVFRFTQSYQAISPYYLTRTPRKPGGARDNYEAFFYGVDTGDTILYDGETLNDYDYWRFYPNGRFHYATEYFSNPATVNNQSVGNFLENEFFWYPTRLVQWGSYEIITNPDGSEQIALRFDSNPDSTEEIDLELGRRRLVRDHACFDNTAWDEAQFPDDLYPPAPPVR